MYLFLNRRNTDIEKGRLNKFVTKNTKIKKDKSQTVKLPYRKRE